MKLTLDTTLREILDADTIELPEDPELHSQVVLAAYNLMKPIKRENLLEDLQAEYDDEDDAYFRHWVDKHRDKVPELLDLWQKYKDNSSYGWNCLYTALNELNVKMETED